VTVHCIAKGSQHTLERAKLDFLFTKIVLQRARSNSLEVRVENEGSCCFIL